MRPLRWLLESEGLAVETFETAEDFLDTCDPGRSGCLVLDAHAGNRRRRAAARAERARRRLAGDRHHRIRRRDHGEPRARGRRARVPQKPFDDALIDVVAHAIEGRSRYALGSQLIASDGS